MASVHIDQIKDTHFIAFLFEQAANVTDNFSFPSSGLGQFFQIVHN